MGQQAYTQQAGGTNPWLDWAGVGLGAYGAYKNAQKPTVNVTWPPK
jgi:hypothetical protein